MNPAEFWIAARIPCALLTGVLACPPLTIARAATESDGQPGAPAATAIAAASRHGAAPVAGGRIANANAVRVRALLAGAQASANRRPRHRTGGQAGVMPGALSMGGPSGISSVAYMSAPGGRSSAPSMSGPGGLSSGRSTGVAGGILQAPSPPGAGTAASQGRAIPTPPRSAAIPASASSGNPKIGGPPTSGGRADVFNRPAVLAPVGGPATARNTKPATIDGRAPRHKF